jgi:DNA repair exonuclease SbcCD nuclease subunit
MERIKQKNPTAILTSDWHLREDVPVCRTDNYWEAQWGKVRNIAALQAKYQCPVFHAGDLFDKWKPSPFLLNYTIQFLPAQFYTLYGQHDLPQHSLKLTDKCGVDVLKVANKLQILRNDRYFGDTLYVDGFHWGESPMDQNIETIRANLHNKRTVLIWHKLVYKGAPPFPGASGGQSIEILHKYPQYDLMLFGDNHKTFVSTYGTQILVNPGSLMRMDADQADHKPCVFLWYAETNTAEQVFLPIEEGVVSRAHLEYKKDRNERIDAFISSLHWNKEEDTDKAMGLSFENNLEEFFQANKTREPIKEIIYKSIE